jgi:hypothetical protein
MIPHTHSGKPTSGCLPLPRGFDVTDLTPQCKPRKVWLVVSYCDDWDGIVGLFANQEDAEKVAAMDSDREFGALCVCESVAEFNSDRPENVPVQPEPPHLTAIIKRCNMCGTISAIDLDNTPEHKKEMEQVGYTVVEVSDSIEACSLIRKQGGLKRCQCYDWIPDKRD